MADNFDRSAILESFLDEVNAYLPDIRADLDRLQQAPGDTRALEESFRRSHTIAGSAGMMGFQALAHVANGMEVTLGEALDHQRPLDAPTLALLRRSLGRLERLIAGIRTNADGSTIAAEDDADRAAWRGAGAVGGARMSDSGLYQGQGMAPGASSGPGMGGPTYPPFAPTPQGAGPSGVLSAPLQIPEWLAAFSGNNGNNRNPGTGGPNATTGAGNPNDSTSAGYGHASGPGMPSVPTVPGAPGAQDIGRAGPSGALSPTQPPAHAWEDMPTVRPPFPPNAQPSGLGGAGGSPSSPMSSPMSSPLRWDTSSANMPPAPGFGARGPSASVYDDATADMTNMGTEALPTVPRGGPPSVAPGVMNSAPSTSNAAAWGMGQGSETERTLPVPAVALPSSARTGSTPTGDSGSNGNLATGGISNDTAVLDELRADTQAVQAQVSTLRGIVQKLQGAMHEAEVERTELRTFLDSSSDAIDRLEAWVRQQIGLNLPPAQMRAYLPLSVVYVVTTRLMKLSNILRETGRDLQLSEEQIDETLTELRRAIEQTGHLYRSVAQVGGSPEQGFQATVAQFAWAPSQPAPTAVESLSPAARAEMERQAREELRRELEDEVRAEVALEVRRDEAQRLRHELEIEVRRDLLKEIMPGANPSLTDMRSLAESMAHIPAMPTIARQVRVTSEQSPEALEVFREEAQDHLKTITEGITALERNSGGMYDEGTLREMRRAMHTLKGSAGMMGFTTVQELAHASEDVLERMANGAASYDPAVLGLLIETTDAIDQMVSERLPDQDEQRSIARDLIARYQSFGGTVNPAVVDTASVDALLPDVMAEAMHARAATNELDDGQVAPTSPDLNVRLQVRELDQLIGLYGELVSTRAVLEERLGKLNTLIAETVHVSERLHAVGGQIETQFEAATLPAGGASATGQMGPGYGPGYNGVPPATGMGPGRGYPPMPYPGPPGYAPQTGGFPRVPAGGRAPHAGEFDELELDRYTEFHRLSRGLSESIADTGQLSHEMESLIREIQITMERESRLSSEFQARLLKAGLVKIQMLAPRLLRAARTTASRLGKEIEFFLEGGETEMERRIIDKIEGPLLHLVRNAVVHGIEMPEERERLGKPRAGRVTLSARYEGNQVVITVTDDGSGIDPQRVRSVALAQGLADEVSHTAPRDALELIFRPGFTTTTTVTEESGRGLGLDVVRDEVTRLRGTVDVDSREGQFTVFTLKLPISLQIARAMLVRVGQQMVAIPMLAVGEIARLEYFPRVAGNEHAVDVRGTEYTLVHLASYLSTSPGKIDGHSPLLLVEAGRQNIALLIDEIQSQKEIVAKPLGTHLRDVRGIAGATVLGNGQVVLILDLQELLTTPPRSEVAIPSANSARLSQPTMIGAGPPPATVLPSGGNSRWSQTTMHTPAPVPDSIARPPSAPAGYGFVVTPREAHGAGASVARTAAGQASYVLVVDDSPTVRRVVGGMLKAHGWRVEVARDGIEAFDVIGHERPAAVLLDIEMPRMDGYELMATVRSQEALRSLPLIVLTSRAAAKHRQRAIQLGADAYIVKPYQDEDLLATIARLVQAQG